MKLMQNLCEYGGMFLIGNALLSGVILVIRLYLTVAGVQFEGYVVGPSLMINMMVSGAFGVGLYMFSKDNDSWQ